MAQNVDLQELVRSLVLEHLPRAREKGLVLDLILDRASPRWLRTDAEATRRNLAALLENAIETTKSGGVLVRVEALLEPEGEEQGTTGARIVVRGAGEASILPVPVL